MNAECHYHKKCERFLQSLNLPPFRGSDKYDTCFCQSCHHKRGDGGAYLRGTPPMPYPLPINWARFSIRVERAHKDWNFAYHGTSFDFVHDILSSCRLLIP
ncbi:neuralized-like protein 4, partial [Saccoglossus kowalevskii]